MPMTGLVEEFLEMKRTSITRLKQTTGRRNAERVVLTWNEKNLDYEIETLKCLDYSHGGAPRVTWNEKNLDYEIETSMESPI